jgi:hypothetical protein
VRQLDDQVVLEFYDKLGAFLLSMRRIDLDYCKSGWDQCCTGAGMLLSAVVGLWFVSSCVAVL